MPRRPRAPAADLTLAVGYLRVSTDEQANGEDAQRAAIERWAAAAGVRVVAWHADHGVSGAAPLDRRPGLLAAVDAVAAAGAGALVVARRDRLARDVMAAAMVEGLVSRAGARVVSAAGEGTDGDATDPAALLMRRLVDAFAEYERALIKSRTRAALAVKACRGELVGTAPLGQRVAADGVQLEADPREAEALALVAQLRADGLSVRKIAAELNARGVPARGASWHPTTVARLLSRGAA
jgi:DNA invertase Pin-like site-specific DNA recombinase